MNRDEAASPDRTEDFQRQALDEVGAIAQLTRDLHAVRGEAARLRAVVDGLQDGVVTVNPELGEVAVNQAAAALLDLAPGEQPESDFHTALSNLSQRALNRDEVNSCISIVESDPTASIECMWRFAGPPSHVFMVSKPVENQDFRGRSWVFYDESGSSSAIESLGRAHALLRASADAMLDPQVLVEAIRDPSGRTIDLIYRDVNNATSTYLGMTREQLVGHSLLESLPNLERSGLMAHYAHCAETGEPVVLDAFPYYNEVLESPRHYDVRAAGAGPNFITLTWRDVTERVETAQRIAEFDQRFRLLAENVGDVVMHIRGDTIAWVSPSVEEALGAPPEHWIGQSLWDLIPDEDRDAHGMVTWLADDLATIPRGRMKGADGSTHWVHVHAKAFYDADGNPDGYTSSFRVIDDEMAAVESAEDARRERARADARYRRIVDSSAIGMCLVTPEGRYEEVNQALCDFFAYDAETLKTKTWQELTAGETLDRDLRKAEEMLTGRIDHYRLTKQYIHADGHLIWADLSVSCLRDAHGQVEYFVSQIIDITAEVRTRAQVAQRDQQNRALAQRLQAQTDRLRSELKAAGAYVNSLLPCNLDGPVQVTQRYLPSRELGGDCFDYRWIDDDHLLIYLIDVSGHGIAPALESISVHNVLRSGSLPTQTLLEPAAVLAELNVKFPMDQHGGNYFTMWYGVYHAPSRTLRYASAGHPPALVFSESAADPVRLASTGMPVGMFANTAFSCDSYRIPHGAEIVLYSDGAFEFPLPEGAAWSLDDFVTLCAALHGLGDWTVDDLAGKLQARTVAGLFSDDCSLLRLRFA